MSKADALIEQLRAERKKLAEQMREMDRLIRVKIAASEAIRDTEKRIGEITGDLVALSRIEEEPESV